MGRFNIFKKKSYMPTLAEKVDALRATPKSDMKQENQTAPRNSVYTPSPDWQHANIANDCIELINSTTNLDTFFSRYDLLIEKLKLLSETSRNIKFFGFIPNDALEKYVVNKDDLIDAFLDRYETHVEEKSNELKTEKGKQNRRKKYYEELMKFSHRLPDSALKRAEAFFQQSTNSSADVKLSTNKNESLSPDQLREQLIDTLTDSAVIATEPRDPFDDLDTSKAADSFIFEKGTARRTDGKPITDDDIPYLVQRGYVNALIREQKRKELRKITAADEMLAENFYLKYHEQIKPLDDLFFSYYRSCQYIKALEALKNIKKFCEKHGKGGAIHYIEMYEMCHNSQRDCFSFEEIIYEQIQSEYDYKQFYNKLLQELIGCNTILQKDLYAKYADQKPMAIRVVKELSDNGIISREKKGNTYLLKMN